MHRAKCITIHCNFSYRVQVIVKMKKADLDMLEAFINQCGHGDTFAEMMPLYSHFHSATQH